MEERDNLLHILKEAKIAMEREDTIALKQLSDQTIHTVTITRDPDNIIIAVIVYSLSKLIERKNYSKYKNWKNFFSAIKRDIAHLIISIEKNDEAEFKKHILNIRKTIDAVSGNLHFHIKNVFEKARINKASRIYEHGLSLQKTAELLGISSWELLNYAGQTGISEMALGLTLSEKNRIKNLMDFIAQK